MSLQELSMPRHVVQLMGRYEFTTGSSLMGSSLNAAWCCLC
jgi:hypothetical protein